MKCANGNNDPEQAIERNRNEKKSKNEKKFK